jgi:molybdopterin converting factor small subunit
MKIGYMLVVPLGAVLCACACLTGCGRDDSPAPAAPAAAPKKDVSRANDAAYQERLKEFGKERQSIGKRRSKIESYMAQLREHAKKALPEGATDAQVLAELENNPKKYPAWRELVAAMKESVKEEKQNLAAAQAAVRQRIVQEAKDSAQDAAKESK